MRLAKIVMLLVVFIIIFNADSITDSTYIPNYCVKKEVKVVDKESQTLFLKISKLKNKYGLEYKNDDDLMESCGLIVKSTRNSEFSKYLVAGIILVESRYNQYAYNKHDGGKGYGQFTGIDKGWHDDILPKNFNPYNKVQAINAIVNRLEKNKEMYGSKFLAVKHYNGSNNKAEQYAKFVYKVKKEIKETKI